MQIVNGTKPAAVDMEEAQSKGRSSLCELLNGQFSVAIEMKNKITLLLTQTLATDEKQPIRAK
jgi:hypothetical protein